MAWLIAMILPLQGFSAAFAVAAGPLHVHVQAAPVVVLVDLRRAFAAPTRALPETVTPWQHAVSHALPLRHLHSPSDATTVEWADPLAIKQPNKADLQASLFIAVVPVMVERIDLPQQADWRSLVMWSPTAADLRPSERPPRAA